MPTRDWTIATCVPQLYLQCRQTAGRVSPRYEFDDRAHINCACQPLAPTPERQLDYPMHWTTAQHGELRHSDPAAHTRRARLNLVTSSSSNSCASEYNALAKPTRCLCPPLRLTPRSPISVPSPAEHHTQSANVEMRVCMPHTIRQPAGMRCRSSSRQHALTTSRYALTLSKTSSMQMLERTSAFRIHGVCESKQIV